MKGFASESCAFSHAVADQGSKEDTYIAPMVFLRVDGRD